MDKMFDEPLLRHQDETISYKDYPPGTPQNTLAGLMTHRVLRPNGTNTATRWNCPAARFRRKTACAKNA